MSRTPKETAWDLYDLFWETAVFDDPFNGSKECALVTARIIRSEYEAEMDGDKYMYWQEVISEIKNIDTK